MFICLLNRFALTALFHWLMWMSIKEMAARATQRDEAFYWSIHIAVPPDEPQTSHLIG